MGCCGCKLDSPSNIESKPKPLDSYFAGVEAELTQEGPKEEVKDRMFLEIEQVALELLEKSTWKQLLSNEKYELKFCEKSVFSQDVHVVSFKLCFQEIVDLELLARLLFNPVERMAWDPSLSEFRILREEEGSQITYYVVPMPVFMTSRDLVERQVVITEANRVRVVSQSVDGSEPKTTCVRGKNYFRYQILQHGTTGTEVHTISQVDLAGSVQKTMASFASGAVTRWADSLVKAVRERQNSQV
mmetsp:Transcript_19307/g.35569  ORF Transcript_19307/g.35569 Transcript_19307/m.35569 type:complete len:244 (-) Transcript_19307:768-1499(-)